MSGKRQGYISWTSILWGLRNCQGCVPKTLILRWDPVSSARIIKFFLWDITDFPWAVQMMNFPGPEKEKNLIPSIFYVTHSELNAILNYRGGSLEGAKLYVSLFPCNECAKAIIQAGIKTIVYGCDKYGDTPAGKSFQEDAGRRRGPLLSV